MILLYALIGVTLGTAVGVLPGIGPALTVALLLPVTYGLDPAGSLIMFAGIYYGGMYGGSTTSILLNTPGESASIVTALEGNKMARAGRGGPALATAAIGSFVAGLLATLALAFLAPHIVKLALVFGPREYFALMVLAFVTVSAAFGESHAQGPHLAVHRPWPRHRRHRRADRPGPPVLWRAATSGRDRGDNPRRRHVRAGRGAVRRRPRPRRLNDKVAGDQGLGPHDRADWRRSWPAWLRGTAIGFPIGAMPAGGADIASFLSYGTEKRMSKHPEEFGHGAIEGVAGPEAANNAAAAGTLVPLLTLGLPTTATAAIMLAGFQQFGLQPGPLLFATAPAAGLGPDRQPSDRQRHAAGPEPAADPLLGQAAAHPAPLALRRHPALRHAWHHRRQPLAGGAVHAADLRLPRLSACASSAIPSRRLSWA